MTDEREKKSVKLKNTHIIRYYFSANKAITKKQFG
jgi:hypothetical protein